MTRKGIKGPTAERLALAARVAELRAERGWSWAQIAVELDISASYVSELFRDPDGALARARKDSYARPCPDCGEPMSGSDGRDDGPEHCADCAPKYAKVWTRDAIAESFREFYERFGRTPSAPDTQMGSPSVAAKMTPERIADAYSAGDVRLPRHSTVIEVFDSWADAQRYAGVPVSLNGQLSHRARRRSAERSDQAIIDAVAAGARTISEIAGEVGREPKSVARRILELHVKGALARERGRGKGHPYLYRLNEGGAMPGKTFVVLYRNGGGDWKEARVEAFTPDAAIERVANGDSASKGFGPGEYVAVPASIWVERPVGEVTKLAVVAK